MILARPNVIRRYITLIACIGKCVIVSGGGVVVDWAYNLQHVQLSLESFHGVV